MCYTSTGFGIPKGHNSQLSDENEWGPGLERITEKPIKPTFIIDPEMVETFKNLMSGKSNEVADIIGNQ